MIRRRTLLQAAGASVASPVAHVLAVPHATPLASLHPSPSAPRRIVFFDERYADSRSFAQAFGAERALASAQDFARLWYGGLQADVCGGGLWLGGLTLPTDHMLLAGLAAEAGLGLHFEAWHDGRGAALTHRVLRGDAASLRDALQSAGADRPEGVSCWAARLALALRHPGRARAAARPLEDGVAAADMPGLLVSWLIA